jgi:flavin-dependent dehydrogenase
LSRSAEWDVIVMGAGPGGSASAALLAKRGHRVLLLDKQQFPRFQIGESLLPVCLPVLAELGVQPHHDTHVFKRGAEFVSEELNKSRIFDFSRGLPGCPTHAWQVDRSGFDAQLRDAAVKAGAEVLHGPQVTKVAFSDTNVTVETSEKSFTARYLVDATGQGRVLARQFDTAESYPGFGHGAAFHHYEGLSDEAFAEIGPGHDIRVMIVPNGWGWVIPLARRRLSVGLVTRRHGVAEELEKYIADSPLIQRWIRGATRRPGRVVQNFSYKNSKPHGARFVCVGDAACFLDPVFSSGVSLALVGASRMTTLLHPALSERTEAAPDLMQALSSSMQRGYDTFSAIIHRFYHTHFIKHFIFGNTSDEAIERGVVTVLAGDVWRDDNHFQNLLLGSRLQPQTRRLQRKSKALDAKHGETLPE